MKFFMQTFSDTIVQNLIESFQRILGESVYNECHW